MVAFTKFHFRKRLICEKFRYCFHDQISKSTLLNEEVSSQPQMILTFETDSRTCQTNFLRSDYCVMDLKFLGQKVWVFLLILRGPHINNIIIIASHQHYYHKEMTDRLNPRKKFQNGWFRLNVARGKHHCGPYVPRGPRVRHTCSIRNLVGYTQVANTTVHIGSSGRDVYKYGVRSRPISYSELYLM